MSDDIEPGDDGRCDVHHGVVRAIKHIPRTHSVTVYRRDHHGHPYGDVHTSHWIDCELWIASRGKPDARFIVDEGFGVLPGHEVVLVNAPGCIVPFRQHNLSTGQLIDHFQPEQLDPLGFLLQCMIGTLVPAMLLRMIVVVTWRDLRSALRYSSEWYQIDDPSIVAICIAIYAVILILVLMISTPFAGRRDARRLRARSMVDERLAAFEAGLAPTRRTRIVTDRPADEPSVSQ